jgi:hypothetical protein
MSKSKITTSANLRASTEGRSQAFKNSHKAARGTFVGNGKVVKTLAQQSRLDSNFKAGVQIVNEMIDEIEIDFMEMM